MAYLYIKEQIQDKRNCTEIQFILADRSPWNGIKSCFHNVEMISGTSSFLIWGIGKSEQQCLRIRWCRCPRWERRSLRAVSAALCVSPCLRCVSLAARWEHCGVGTGGLKCSKERESSAFWFICYYTSGQVLYHVAHAWRYSNLHWTQPWAFFYPALSRSCIKSSPEVPPTSTLLWSMRKTLL